MNLRFAKWQGTGNDFVVVDSPPSLLSMDQWSQMAPLICDRRLGVGADGILLLQDSSAADFEMTVLNADGSIAQMCGNGIRCAVRHRARGISSPMSLRVQTGAGVLAAAVLPEGLVRVDMGKPRLAAAEIPLKDGDSQTALRVPLSGTGLEFACVSMGNPHAVAFVADLATLDFAAVGPAVSGHERFPEGVNAGFAQVISRHEIRLAVWERGCGPTLACGTGACAAVVAGTLTDRLESPVRVHLPGGELDIEWSPGGSVTMTGPAVPVFAGELDLESLTHFHLPSVGKAPL